MLREDDVGAERAHLVGVERLDRSLRPDGHEGRRADVAVRRGEDAGAGRAVGRVEAKAHELAGRNDCAARPGPPRASTRYERIVEALTHGTRKRAESATIVARHSHAHSTTIASPNE